MVTSLRCSIKLFLVELKAKLLNFFDHQVHLPLVDEVLPPSIDLLDDLG